MRTLLALHVAGTRNAGDLASTPADYFGFPGWLVVRADLRNPPDIKPDAVLYGGGSIIASPFFRRWPCPTIAWGVGHHVRRRPWDDEMISEHQRAAGLCDLYFPRDAVGLDSVPCASCMHPIFDEASAPVYDVVRYSAHHRVEVDQPADAPHMTNEDGDIRAAVRFLGSGRLVVTSSYHGAFWARLLGRQVRLMSWGSKFDYLPTADLAACRDANRRAHALVLDLLDSVH